MSESKTLAVKLVEAWDTIENPELDGTNPHFNSKYASLKAIMAVVKAACKPQGFKYGQKLAKAENGYVMRSFITDGTDTLELSEFPVETPPNPQSFGSILTYTKRQQAQLDWGIVGEEDDDGNAGATAYTQPKTRQQSRQQAAKKQPSEAERKAKGIKAIGEARAEAERLGILPSGIDSLLGKYVEGGDVTVMTLDELTAAYKEIQGLIKDRHQLMDEGLVPEVE